MHTVEMFTITGFLMHFPTNCIGTKAKHGRPSPLPESCSCGAVHETLQHSCLKQATQQALPRHPSIQGFRGDVRTFCSPLADIDSPAGFLLRELPWLSSRDEWNDGVLSQIEASGSTVV